MIMTISTRHPTHPSKHAGLTPVYIPSHRERDDNYKGVIVQLDPRWRIIECRDAIQWIIQKRSAEPSHSGEWRGVSYLVSRDALIELSVNRGLLSDPSKRAVLEALPPQTHNMPFMPSSSQMEDE
jgi:hypothetical protein